MISSPLPYQNHKNPDSSSSDRALTKFEHGSAPDTVVISPPQASAARRRTVSKSRLIRPLGYLLGSFVLLGSLSACGGGSDSGGGGTASGGAPGSTPAGGTSKAAVLHCAPAA
jgi:hypothetical protein